MAEKEDALATLIAKEEIRELALLYSRGVDRNDIALLRSLYTKDAIDNHGPTYRGPADGFLDFMEKAMPRMQYSGHHVCNHLVSVDGEEAEGEVYCIACDVIPDGKGGSIQHLLCVRYIDRYRKEDGRWRFAERNVTYDFRNHIPLALPHEPRLSPLEDPSVTTLRSRLFARGPRA